MADVIFLLLIFFMITSTLIMPSAMEVNLPESTEQTIEKPRTEVYIDSLRQMYVVADRNDSVSALRQLVAVNEATLQATLLNLRSEGKLESVALYADRVVPYAAVIRVLDMAARNDIKMVLATRPLSGF